MGAINIKHTGSGGSVSLSSDGTDLLLDGTAIGGGQPFTTPEVKTTSWSVTNADKGKVFVVDTDNLTLTLPDSSTLDDDWFIRLYTKGNSFQPSYGVVGDLTINPQYSTFGGRVNNNTTWITRSRQGGILFKDPEQASNYIFDVHSTTWDIDVHSTENANRANATGWGSIAISGQATASATGSIAIGYLATASGTDSVAIGGNSAQATATDAIAIGASLANAANGIAIGINNSTTSYGATATDGIAIGQLAKAPTADGIAIGKNANANNGAIAIGYNSYTTAVRGVAVGYDTYAGYQAATFGYGNASSGNFSLAVGHSNTASHVNSAAIGYGVQTTASNQVALGGSTQTVRISETYTLPATDGTIGQVLTTDGAGAVTFADAGGGGASALTIEDKTTAYTVIADDLGKVINCTTGTFTVTLTAAATLGAGFNVTIWNTSDTATHVITIDPSGAETIDGVATLILRRGEGMQIICNGTNWETGNKKVMRGYAENLTNAAVRPVASANRAIAIGESAVSSSPEGIAFGYGATASSNYAVSLGARAVSSAVASIAIGFEAAASSNSATAIGANSSAAAAKSLGAGAVALGGAYASGADSFAAAIGNNTSSYGATGANSIAMGYQAKATQADGIAIGDRVVATGNPSIAVGREITASGAGSAGFGNNYHGTNTVSGAGAVVVTGGGVTASGTKSVVFGSYSKATAERSFAFGINATALTYGKFAFSAKGFNQDFYVDGSAQAGLSILSRITTDATSTYLSGSANATSTNQIILPNNSAYSFSGMIVARQDPAAGTACAAWKVEGLIRREANAASTVLVNYALTVLDNTPAWDITLTADTTAGALKITATGAAATTIRWVATINTAEVNFLN